MKTKIIFSFWIVSLIAHANQLTFPSGDANSATILKAAGETTSWKLDGPRGQDKQVFRMLSERSAEWQRLPGVKFRIKLLDAHTTTLTLNIYCFDADSSSPPEATLDGDYPPGNESERWNFAEIRVPLDPQARFTTVVGPYTDQPFVKLEKALSANRLRKELEDRRVQEIELQNFDGNGKNIVVKATNTKDRQVLRKESNEWEGRE